VLGISFRTVDVTSIYLVRVVHFTPSYNEMTVASIRFPSVVSQILYKLNTSELSKTHFQMNFICTSSGDPTGLLFNGYQRLLSRG